MWPCRRWWPTPTPCSIWPAPRTCRWLPARIAPWWNAPRDASHMHGADGLGNAGLPASTREVSSMHAVELMRRVLNESADPVTIVALAPMTNLALLLRTYPEVADRIERVVFMGGSA